MPTSLRPRAPRWASGGVFTIVPDLVALAWLQARMVFFIAGGYGWDPRDPMRPAELLALTGLLPRPGGARVALDGAGKTVAEHYVGLQAPARRGARLQAGEDGQQVGGEEDRGARSIPGFAIVYSSVSNRRDTNALGKRAVAFYGGTQAPTYRAAGCRPR